MNPGLIHKVIIQNNNWHSAQAWCEQNIGEFDDTWYKLGIDPLEAMMRPVGAKIQTVWYFRNEKDAMMFKLRWS